MSNGGEFLNALDPDVLSFIPIDEPPEPTGEMIGQIQFQIWQVKYKIFQTAVTKNNDVGVLAHPPRFNRKP